MFKKSLRFAKKTIRNAGCNVINTDSINAVLEAAAKVKSPVVIQFSNGGAQFVAGKGLKLEGQQTAILGAISGAQHVHLWHKPTAYQSFYIQTTRQKNCCLGLMVC